ncbi:MAG: response regulator [Candidatus Tectomicrobia bacterium]|uniref:Response regulator n=1 Tax=Tectimicrobiota bacterium TaxID=2528274 RepID=A0A937W4K1_UNCTE|nr:response regulator [Candidatus Tectomicrobia bacterium]
MHPAHGSLLIVDNDRDHAALLATFLESQGYTIALAEHGRHALDILQERSYDLMVLDMLLPEMDSLDVLAALQATETLAQLPVIVLAATDETERIVRCMDMGAVDYLPKPCHPVLLRARIASCLEKKRLYDQHVQALHQLELLNQNLTNRVSEAASALETSAEIRAQHVREMEAASAIARAMNSLMDVHELLTFVMDKSKEVMHAEASSLLMLDKEADVLRFHVARGTAGAALRSATVQLGHGIVGWVAQTGEPQLIPDAYQDPRFDPSYDKRSGFRTRSILTVPLKVKDEVMGVVQVINKIGARSLIPTTWTCFYRSPVKPAWRWIMLASTNTPVLWPKTCAMRSNRSAR